MTRARRAVPPGDGLPDVRDGLTRVERVVLETLAACQAEAGGRAVPVALLYGRLSERVDLTAPQLVRLLQRLGAGGSVRARGR